ncbi:hypothetical protein D3C78_1492960 [compost metagenome]
MDWYTYCHPLLVRGSPHLHQPRVELIAFFAFISIVHVDSHLLQLLFEIFVRMISWQALLDSQEYFGYAFH